jgi:hypothetical protein
MEDRPSNLPRWYLDEAIPRLKEIERLSPACKWDEMAPGWEAMRARERWTELMKIQSEAECRAGL